MGSKKIIISEEQKRQLNEILDSEVKAEMSLPNHLLRDIKANNTSLSDFPFFTKPNGKRYLIRMITNRYDEVIGHFDDDVQNIGTDRIEEEVMKVLEKCKKKEENIRPQLEKICLDTLIDLFHLPENSFSFSCSLGEIDEDKSFNVNPMPVNGDITFTDMDSMDSEDIEITKRRMINCLSLGTAMRLFDKCRSLYLEKLFDLDEELPYLYSRFMKLNELYIFRKDVRIRDRAHQQGGYVEVILGNDNDTLPQIDARAVIFPILLTESIKGFMELFASHGLPDDLKEAKKIVDIADALVYEPWDMRIGPALFDTIYSKLDRVDSTVIPHFYKELVEMKGDDFLEVVKGCVCNVDEVSDYLNVVYEDSEHNTEYDDFEYKLLQKQDADSLIVDSENLE